MVVLIMTQGMNPYLQAILREQKYQPLSAQSDKVLEARDNLGVICASHFDSKSCDIDDLLVFVDSLSHIKQIQAADAGLQQVSLYLWCDVQASQLRFCLATDLQRNQLPFKCSINANATLDAVISGFLRMNSQGEIPFTDLAEDGPERNLWHDPKPVLDVFVRELFRSLPGDQQTNCERPTGL